MFVNEIAVHIPQLIEHLRFGQDQPVVFDEEVQGAVFFWGKIYGTAAQRGGLPGEIDPQKAVLIQVMVRVALFQRFQYGCNLPAQHRHGKRLGNIIRTAGFIAPQHIAFPVVGGEKDDVSLRAMFLDLSAQVEPAAVR